MNRRHFLGAVGTTIPLFAGCSGNSTDGSTEETTTTQHTTVGGLETTVTAATSTMTTTDPTTKTTTTKSSTTTPATTTATTYDGANVLHASGQLGDNRSHISSYSSQHVTAKLFPEDRTVERYSGESVRLFAFIYRFPRQKMGGYAVSDPFDLTESQTVTVEFDPEESNAPVGKRLLYLAFLVPGDTDGWDDLDASELLFFHETDPFVLADDHKSIEQKPADVALGDHDGQRYERRNVEGAYRILLSGTTADASWSTDFSIANSQYVTFRRKSRWNDPADYLQTERKNGIVGELSTLLNRTAKDSSLTEQATRVQLAADFVQSLPQTGTSSRQKYAVETVAEGGGSSADTSLALASVLQTDPFDANTALVRFGDHTAVGVAGVGGLSGVSWEHGGTTYYHVETTDPEQAVGDLPEQYRDSDPEIVEL